MSNQNSQEVSDMKQPFNTVDPMAEAIGIVEEVRSTEIVLCIRKRCVISVKSEELREWVNDLKVGSRVAILVLDDGTIRVRRKE